jgi:hypothetical protein
MLYIGYLNYDKNHLGSIVYYNRVWLVEQLLLHPGSEILGIDQSQYYNVKCDTLVTNRNRNITLHILVV